MRTSGIGKDNARARCGETLWIRNGGDQRERRSKRVGLKTKLNDATRTRHAFVEQKPSASSWMRLTGYITPEAIEARCGPSSTLKHGKNGGLSNRSRDMQHCLRAGIEATSDVAKIIRMKPPQTTQLTARVRDVSERKRRVEPWRWRSSSIASITTWRCVKLDATHRQDERRW